MARPESERRQFKRISVKALVRYAPRQYGSDVPPDLWEGQTINVSRSGAALNLPHRLRRGGAIEMSLIQSNPPRCVMVVGRVVRCERIPGGDRLEADGSTHPRYLVAVKFDRVLDIEELALLRESAAPEATEVERRKKEATG